MAEMVVAEFQVPGDACWVTEPELDEVLRNPSKLKEFIARSKMTRAEIAAAQGKKGAC